MNATLPQIMSDTLTYLMTLSDEGVRPQEAKTRLRLLQQRYPDAGMHLVWEEEGYDASIHYDVLVHLAEGATVSLSFCPDRAIPWPLRGAHHWSERELLRVNQTSLRVAQGMACLDFIWDEAPILTRLINVCLVQETLDQAPIDLPDTELQRGMDAFRRAHELYTAEATALWMHQRGMTQEHLERVVADNLAIAKLRDQVAAAQVECYFAEHRAAFDTAQIAQIVYVDEASARQASQQIHTGAADFYAVAQRQVLAAGQAGREVAPFFRTLQRAEVDEALGAAIFTATSGEVVGPMRLAKGYALAQVLSVTPARLDEPTRESIKTLLFEAWLAERRRAASIEWYWGNTERTTQVA